MTKSLTDYNSKDPWEDEDYIKHTYKGDYKNLNFDRLKILRAKPSPFNEDSTKLSYILQYEKNKFTNLKNTLIKRWSSLSLKVKNQYPLFDSIEAFLNDDSKNGFIIAEIINERKYSNSSLFEICDTSGYVNVLKRTFLEKKEFKNKKEERTFIAQQELIIDLYKDEYESLFRKQYPLWPLLTKKKLNLNQYSLQRSEILYDFLKPGLTLGVFLTKEALEKNIIDLNNNELKKIIDETKIKISTAIRAVLLPDVRSDNEWKSNSDSKLVICSDIHVGSLTFCESDFKSLLIRINDDVKVKYFVMNGDLVDGINVYPRQKKDLALQTFEDQYAMLAKLVNILRADITLIFIPGNHDFVSKVEPQTWTQKIKDIILSNVDSTRSVLFASNPCYLALDEIRCYFSHGIGITETARNIGLFNFENPAEILNFLVDTRNVCAISQDAPIRPTTIPHHLIPEDFNIISTGHVHHQTKFIRDDSRILLCTGAFQNLTAYMDFLGFKPTVSTAWCITLNDINSAEYWDLSSESTKYTTYKAVESQKEEE